MFKVWTVTHPDDTSEHKNLYDAYCAMTELVEDGFEPLCRDIYNVGEPVLSYEEVTNRLHQ